MKKKIVASFIGRNHEFQLAQAVDAEAAGERTGIEVQVLFAEENPIVQIHQLFQQIGQPEEERAAAFVMEPIKDAGIDRLAKNAVAAGIGWLPLNRSAPYLAALRATAPKLPICNLVTDQVEAGRIQGRQIRALLPRGGSVLYVHGPAMTLVEERVRGTEEAIAGGGITLYKVSGTWTGASAEKAVVSWFRLKDRSAAGSTDLIACQNDHMAAGARQGLLAARPEFADIPILGMDGLPRGGQQMVREKELAATVVIPCNAGRAVEIVAKWLRDGIAPPERVLQSPASFPPEIDLRPRAARAPA